MDFNEPYDEERENLIRQRKMASAFIRKKPIRMAVIEDYNGQCVACGATDKLELDHIKSIEEGGEPTDINNLWVLCKSCNSRKKDHSVQWLYDTNKALGICLPEGSPMLDYLDKVR